MLIWPKQKCEFIKCILSHFEGRQIVFSPLEDPKLVVYHITYILQEWREHTKETTEQLCTRLRTMPLATIF